MKPSILIVMAIILLVACNRKRNELTLRNQQLSGVIQQRDSLIKELGYTLDELEKNLGILGTAKDARTNVKARMQHDISHINRLIDQNQRKYDSLRTVLGWRQARYSELTGRMDSLSSELALSRTRIGELTNQVNAYNNQVNSQADALSRVQAISNDQSVKIEQMTRQLNTGYVVVGKEKDLLDNEIIYKDGGFLGIIGRTDRFNPTFKNDLFKRIDILENQMIEVKKDRKKDKINIVTVHPPESYTLKEVNEETAMVEINDPARFWEASKYLVVMHD